MCVQRTCRARLAGDWRPGSCSGATSCSSSCRHRLSAGRTQSKEYAEPEWYADLWLTIVWVVYLLVFLARFGNARSRTSMWPTGSIWPSSSPLRCCTSSTILACRSACRLEKLYPLVRRAGCADPVVVRPQCGGLLPDRRLSGDHVLLRAQSGETADLLLPAVDRAFLVADLSLHLGRSPSPALHGLPDWAQTLGMTFSIMLWMPSWGGMINGLMTLSGAWDKLRTDPVIRFMVVSLAFYGMSTFEGPLMSIKAVNSSATTRTGPSVTCTPARWAGSA